MGSFMGHVDEATVFIILAVWWMYKGFTNYIKARQGRGQYQIQTSYWCMIRGKRLPLEQILKISFPVIGFMAEVIDGKFRFLDEKGNFMGLNHMQHMSIYGIFVLHGVIDLLLKLEVTWVPPKMDFISAGVAFFWYALSFYYHANMEGKEKLEVLIHIMPTYFMYVIGITCFLAIWKPQCFYIDIIRSYGLLMLGTWFIHTSYIMYIPGFPGSKANPAWDRSDHRNVHFIIAAFGYHMIINFIVVLVIYTVCHVVLSSGMSHVGLKYDIIQRKDEEEAVLMEDQDDPPLNHVTPPKKTTEF